MSASRGSDTAPQPLTVRSIPDRLIRLDRLIRRAQKLFHPEAALECVLRPAMLDLNGALEGFAITLYITALGHDADSASHNWSAALEDVVHLLRAKELEPARGSATID